MTQQLVTLEEVAQVTGQKIEKVRAECQELGIYIETDWASRPAIPVNDARGIVSGDLRRTQEHSEAWSRHLRACKKWQESRSAAVNAGADEAQAKAESRARLRGRLPGANGSLSPGERAATRREGAMHAGAQYERMHPRPEFNGTRNTVNLLYVPESEEGSMVAAATGALLRPVRRNAPTGKEVQ